MGDDVFRTIPIRHLGHGFAIAEGVFFVVSPRVHDLLHMVGTGYMITHCLFNALNAPAAKQAVVALIDTAIFDFLASALIPTVLTYHLVRVLYRIFGELGLPNIIHKWGPPIITLCVLVAATDFIDTTVEDVMTATVRTLYQ